MADRKEIGVDELILQIGKQAKLAAQSLALASPDAKNIALNTAAQSLRDRKHEILSANIKDMEFGRNKGLSDAMLDRLLLDETRIEAMASGIEEIAKLPDPVGDIMASWDRPNGLVIERVRVPLGVIGIIYESRPNVTADAGALCLKSGNVAILRGGSESLNSSGLITECLQTGLQKAGIDENAVQMIPTRDRAAVGALLSMSEYVDVIVPRGGKSLIERVMNDAKMPVFAHLEGLCHVYIDGAADAQKAVDITLNAKMRRTGVCGAAETLLVDEKVAGTLLPMILDALDLAGCQIRGDAKTCSLFPNATRATDDDWHTEYLDKIISVRIVAGAQAAIDHINHYSSHHTESIITEDQRVADKFLNEVDSAIVMHNASTQ